MCSPTIGATNVFIQEILETVNIAGEAIAGSGGISSNGFWPVLF